VGRPLFPGRTCFPLSVDPLHPSSDTVWDQLAVIFDIIRSPNEEDTAILGPVKSYLDKMHKRYATQLSSLYPGANAQALDLLNKLLYFNPHKRITVKEALAHPYIFPVRDLRLEVDLPEPIGELDLGVRTQEEIKRLILKEAQVYYFKDDVVDEVGCKD
jgi:serine/threonine protein kinase